MKPFLILGEPEDLHAHYVHWALKAAGFETRFIYSSHCASHTTLYLDGVTDRFTSAEWNDAEAAWCRRLPRPAVVEKGHSEGDGFILVEERRFTKWLIEMQQDCAMRWINSPGAAMRTENKFIQLKEARSHGIPVPRTLVTAQPDRFRAFLRAHGTIVAKPLCGYSWEEASGETLTAFATLLDAKRGSELSDEDIAQCVTIYQERVDKVSDVRMLVMGGDVFAYEVVQNGERYFDFRVGFYQENYLRYHPLPVPAELKKKIIAFMNSMNINFASADFVLTPSGEWVFLDLNPNGQWLFIEKESPEARIGQKFCSFFVNGRVDPKTESLFPSFSDYIASDQTKSFAKAYREHAALQPTSSDTWSERQA